MNKKLETLRQLSEFHVNELGDSVVPYSFRDETEIENRFGNKKSRVTRRTIEVGGITYVVDITDNGGGNFAASFNTLNNPSYGSTNDGQPLTALSAIFQEIAAFLKRQPKLTSVSFGSNDERRVRVYSRLLPKVLQRAGIRGRLVPIDFGAKLIFEAGDILRELCNLAEAAGRKGTFQDLASKNKPPYGLWIFGNGDFAIVDFECHGDYVEEYIEKHGISDGVGREYIWAFFDAKWARVVFNWDPRTKEPELFWQVGKGVKPTSRQMNTIYDIAHLYKIREIRDVDWKMDW